MSQPKLHASLYTGLEDAVVELSDNFNLHDIGECTVLPSSYVGGLWHMQQQFQDSMTVARHFRKVDLFGMVTANPNWPEIIAELLPGQTSADHPDLVSHVFRLKLKAIIDDIYKNRVFGKTVAYVYVIELQKRGLPHAHILIFLDGQDKILTPLDIDSAIRAYWPDPDTEPLLFETVKNSMVHSPCGASNPLSPCMENGKCSKCYPKAFAETTRLDEHSYPHY